MSEQEWVERVHKARGQASKAERDEKAQEPEQDEGEGSQEGTGATEKDQEPSTPQEPRSSPVKRSNVKTAGKGTGHGSDSAPSRRRRSS